jgi:hypothetical protein
MINMYLVLMLDNYLGSFQTRSAIKNNPVCHSTNQLREGTLLPHFLKVSVSFSQNSFDSYFKRLNLQGKWW